MDTALLNRPKSDEAANPPLAEDVFEIKINPPTEAEVRAATKAMKTIHAEMWKAKILTDLFTTIWTKDNIPAHWTKGLVVRLPKKEDLQNCNNWRGITI